MDSIALYYQRADSSPPTERPVILRGCRGHRFPKGGALAEGATAAGLRIQYFVENENGPGTYNLLTPEGFRLFDPAVTWALTQK